VFLATHEFEPFFDAEEMENQEEKDPDFKRKKRETQEKQQKLNGWEIGYQRFTINGKCLGYGEPVRVKENQRILFHFLNASATENIQLALPGHQFQVVAHDGNPVPQPQSGRCAQIGHRRANFGNRGDEESGVWILGTPMDDDRKERNGDSCRICAKDWAPRCVKPQKKVWDYTLFGLSRTAQNPTSSHYRLASQNGAPRKMFGLILQSCRDSICERRVPGVDI
jgi:hypothetical protein